MKFGIKTIGSMAAAAMLFCGAAQAREYNINIYGYGEWAQYAFWHDISDDFLYTQKGCTDIDSAQQYDDVGKITGHWIIRGQSCNSGHTYYIRFSSNTSYDGIWACNGDPTYNAPSDCDSYGDRFRMMADETNTDWRSGEVNGLACKEVTIGASDVSGEAFGQRSPFNMVPAIDTSMFSENSIETPFAVTFGFFKNRIAFPDLTNISRLQALMIFSGKPIKWNRFGTNEDPCDESQYTYPDKYIIVCLREAGSGAHATLDRAVMRKDQALATTAFNPTRKFHDSLSGMMYCVNSNNGISTATHAAIGYAEADQRRECYNCVNTPERSDDDLCNGVTYPSGNMGDLRYGKTEAIRYEGVVANAANVAHCKYSFWSKLRLYLCDGDPYDLGEQFGEYAEGNVVDYYNASRPSLELYKCRKDSDFAMPTLY